MSRNSNYFSPVHLRRDYRGTNDVLGAALATNAVTVNGQTAWRKGEYFWATIKSNNNAAAQWEGVSVVSGGNTNTGNLLVPQTQQNFVYDADGNLVSDGLWTNVWNAENRLVCSTSLPNVPSGGRMKEEWSYLPDGRWSQRIVSTWNTNTLNYQPSTTNHFVWDGKVLAAIVDQTNGLVMSFMRGMDLSGSLQGAGGVGGLLAVSFKTSGTHFAAFDGNGNVAALVNAADGTVSANYEFGPFGEAVRITGAVGKLNPIRFSTQFADDVRNVVKYLYREYTPSTGTWPNRDPLEELESQNCYGFLHNQPISSADPDGRMTVTWDGSQFKQYDCGGWDAVWHYYFDDITDDSYFIAEITISIQWNRCDQTKHFVKQVTYYEAIPQVIKKGDVVKDNDSMTGYLDTMGSQTVLGRLRTFRATPLVKATVDSWQMGTGTLAPDMKISLNPPLFWNSPSYSSGIDGYRFSNIDSWRCCCRTHENSAYQHFP